MSSGKVQVTLELCVAVSHVALRTHIYYKIKHAWPFPGSEWYLYDCYSKGQKKESVFLCCF